MIRPSFAILFLIATAFVCGGWPKHAAYGQEVSPSSKAGSAAGGRVVITIGDEKITAADIDNFIQALPPQYQAYYGGPGKHLLPQYIISMKVLSSEAIKLKLDNQPAVERALEVSRESILADAARKHMMKGIVVTDQELRELYQRDKTLSEEIRIRHILIGTENAPLHPRVAGHPALSEPEARKKLEDIRKQIQDGADFAQMAKQYSEDRDTAASGGDMGVIQTDKVVPPIVKAARALEPGQVSGLILTPSGVEIIQVEDKKIKSFEEAKPVLETQLRQAKAGEIVKHLMENYHLVVDQDFFAGTSAKPQTLPGSPPGH